MSITISTPVTTTPCQFIKPDGPILLMGSCFSDAVGLRMETCGLPTLRNPFGVLYNPHAIATALEYSLTGRPLDESLLVHHDGLWHSWLHHTTYSTVSREACLDQCQAQIDLTHTFLQQCSTIVVTWGTAYAYYLIADPPDGYKRETPLLVANCHKVPARFFNRERLDIEAIVAQWLTLTEQLLAFPAHPHLIFTVSPIRHMADSAHGNQLSKATLLLAMERLLGQLPASRCHYFPAYEIVMDELRDYRYYARDLVHPSDLAADIIWQRFQETFMNADTQEYCLQEAKKYRQSLHRPINKA